MPCHVRDDGAEPATGAHSRPLHTRALSLFLLSTWLGFLLGLARSRPLTRCPPVAGSAFWPVEHFAPDESKTPRRRRATLPRHPRDQLFHQDSADAGDSFMHHGFRSRVRRQRAKFERPMSDAPHSTLVTRRATFKPANLFNK